MRSISADRVHAPSRYAERRTGNDRRNHLIALSSSAALGGGVALAMVLALPAPAGAAGPAPVLLGTASAYSVLAGQSVTNTGPSTLDANVGVSPGTAISGFPPGVFGGVKHSADAPALQAQSDLTTAYNSAAGRAQTANVAADLVGQTLVPGVYQSPGALGLTGALTLDAQGNRDSVFIFQAASTLITGSASRIIMINGAQPCNVWWQVGSSATLGTGSSFIGTIMALTSITVTTGVTVEGRALARNGSVTLDTDTFIQPACLTGPVPTAGSSTPGSSTPGSSTAGSSTTGSSPGGSSSPRATPGTGTDSAPAVRKSVLAVSSGSTSPTSGTGTTSASARTGSPSRTTTIVTLSRTGLSSLVRQLLLITPLLFILGAIMIVLGRRRTAARHRR
jgi:hypothetical protein